MKKNKDILSEVFKDKHLTTVWAKLFAFSCGFFLFPHLFLYLHNKNIRGKNK